jgi:hypothetical protein
MQNILTTKLTKSTEEKVVFLFKAPSNKNKEKQQISQITQIKIVFIKQLFLWN